MLAARRNHPEVERRFPAVTYGLVLMVCGSLAYLAGGCEIGIVRSRVSVERSAGVMLHLVFLDLGGATLELITYEGGKPVRRVFTLATNLIASRSKTCEGPGRRLGP